MAAEELLPKRQHALPGVPDKRLRPARGIHLSELAPEQMLAQQEVPLAPGRAAAAGHHDVPRRQGGSRGAAARGRGVRAPTSPPTRMPPQIPPGATSFRCGERMAVCDDIGGIITYQIVRLRGMAHRKGPWAITFRASGGDATAWAAPAVRSTRRRPSGPRGWVVRRGTPVAAQATSGRFGGRRAHRRPGRERTRRRGPAGR
jgi:hypothetical protein